MEKKDYYTLKEIILGLNNEYQLHQRELEKLKEFCEMDEKKVVDFNFTVFQPGFPLERRNPVLLCHYEPKQNIIQRVITNFSKKNGLYFDNSTAYLVTDYNQYYFYGHSGYPIHVKYDYGIDQKFHEQVHIILDSDFSRNINSGYIDTICSDIDSNFHIAFNCIRLVIQSDTDQFQKSRIHYDSTSNSLEFSMDRGTLSNQYIEDILNLKFASSDLNPYHITTINTSKMTEKPIVLGYVGPVHSMEFSIIEEENQVVLSKRK